MAKCLDCGKPIAKTKMHCGECRDRLNELARGGNASSLIHACANCGRPILFTKALCGPCDWRRHVKARRAERHGEAPNA